jgi:hypothetical protein
VVPIDRYSFKDVPLDLLFNYFSAPKCSKAENRYVLPNRHYLKPSGRLQIPGQILGSGTGGGIVVPVQVSETMLHNNSAPSSTATNVMPIFPTS